MVQVRRSSQQGLSLIELVVASAILATLVRFAVPAAQDLLLSIGLASASSELVSDLVLARAEALKRNRRVALCKSSDGEHCAQAGGWEQGWVYLVYGNDGWDVLADYTVNLGPSMQPANELSDQILEAFHEHAQG